MREAYHAIGAPFQYADGAIESVVRQAAYAAGNHTFMDLTIPASALHGSVTGRFFMARCTIDATAPVVSAVHTKPLRTDWGIYLRRPLFITRSRAAIDLPDATIITVWLPQNRDAGYSRLRTKGVGSRLNLLGPYGRPFQLPSHTRQLLLATQSDFAPLTLPAAEEMLDRGGRVTLVVRDKQAGDAQGSSHVADTSPSVEAGLLALFPIAVEIQSATLTGQWLECIANGVNWADSMVIMDTALTPQAWADRIRQRRMTLDQEFAQILVPADLLCCTGACMSCVVPRTNGSLTRACLHGPLFALTELID